MKVVKSCLVVVLICMFSITMCYAGTVESASTNQNNSDVLELTEAEKKFVNEHPIIRMGVDPNYAPYGFIDTDGVYKGISAEFVNLIFEKTGLQMVVETNLTWSEAYEKAVNKEIDILPCVSKTTAREQYFQFTDSYYNFQRALFINDNNKEIKSFGDLDGKKVAVQTNSSLQEYMADYGNIELHMYPTVEKAIKAVMDGKETAFVGNLATTSYYIKSAGITNLNYITIDTITNQSLCFGVRNDWPELTSIINKVLDHVSEEEIININNKWINIEPESDYATLIKIAEIAGAIIAIVFLVSVFWIVELKREVKIRKKTQEELKMAKDEAEKSNQIKSMFLARMSHEIRTPLNAIMGMAYLVKRKGVTSTQSVYLDKLTQASKDMLGIINDILDFSKIESGKIKIETISFELDKVLLQVINIISVRVEEQGIEFVLNKDPNIPNFYIGDPIRIEQILLNIINNAVKFTQKGSVTLSITSNSQSKNEHILKFSVKDTGIGMSQEQINQLFVPFEQGDSSINRRFGGTGLGLSIVKNLSELMNGNVQVESTVNEGSTFTVYLPLKVDMEKEAMGFEKSNRESFSGIYALVVDKSKNIQKALWDCFNAYGIEAEFASSDVEAMDFVQAREDNHRRPFNLYIVDSLVPLNGGIDFFRRLKKLPYYNTTTKLVLMVPIAREDLFDEIETEGIDFGIAKPIVPSVLYNGIIDMFKIQQSTDLKISNENEEQMAPYPYHLLLVEDNLTNQLIAGTILEQAGFRVSITNNGEEGYHYYKENQKDIELILMDIHMPVMDGYKASELIREFDKDIPIVAMTADAVSGVIETCRSHGIKYYVSKPFEPQQLITTILNLMPSKEEMESKKMARKEMDEKTVSESELSAVAKSTDLKQSTDVKQSSDIMQNDAEKVLDIADGMKRMGIDMKVYCMILKEYYHENIEVGKSLRETIEAKQLVDAEQIVHKVKSSSGSIGGKRLYEIASDLQKLLKEQNESAIITKHEQFQNMLQKMLTEIEQLLKDNDIEV